jgi:hypothetical protein
MNAIVRVHQIVVRELGQQTEAGAGEEVDRYEYSGSQSGLAAS